MLPFFGEDIVDYNDATQGSLEDIVAPKVGEKGFSRGNQFPWYYTYSENGA